MPRYFCNLKCERLWIVSSLNKWRDGNNPNIISSSSYGKCGDGTNTGRLPCHYCKIPESKSGVKLKGCGKCFRVGYCNKDCQKRGWQRHRDQSCERTVKSTQVEDIAKRDFVISALDEEKERRDSILQKEVARLHEQAKADCERELVPVEVEETVRVCGPVSPTLQKPSGRRHHKKNLKKKLEKQMLEEWTKHEKRSLDQIESKLQLAQDRVKDLEQENKIAEANIRALKERTEDATLCQICFSGNKNICMHPCGHICCCEQCAVPLTACPFCRAQIDSKTRVLLL